MGGGILSPVPRPLAVVLVVAAAVVLSSCRLEVGVVVRLEPDGTGEVTVTATADADVVTQAPGLAAHLRFDDATAAGWTVEGATETEDGGLTVTLRHPAASAEEATNLLASLGPPFVGVTLARTVVSEDEVTVTLDGRLELTGGFESFADADLVGAAGGVPFADELQASGATPATSMGVVLRAELPGDIQSTTGRKEAGGLVWDAPLDGSSVDVATTTVQRADEGAWWAGPLSWLALALLVAWLALVVVVFVAAVRARRRRRHRHPVLH
jgi:hypothetical protein